MVHLSTVILNLERIAHEWEGMDSSEKEQFRLTLAERLATNGEQLFQVSAQVRRGGGI